jgi:hypothetical protein
MKWKRFGLIDSVLCEFPDGNDGYGFGVVTIITFPQKAVRLPERKTMMRNWADSL